MAKRQAADKVLESTKEKLMSMMGGFSHNTAINWLREKFPSFETSQTSPIELEGKSEPDYFTSANLLGYVTKLPEKAGADAVNKPLLVAAVKMKGVITERTSRSIQFNFAKRVLRDAVNYGATGLSGLPSQGLFFFYDKGGNFRLSLVTGEVEGRRFKFNEAKRQSFYIEPDAANNIVRRRFYDDIRTFADLKEVFSVEKLTKEFYKRLFDWYTWAMDSGVTFPNVLNAPKDPKKEAEYTNEAIIRLITRLMFTWFIRQKNLVPQELFDKEALGGILKSFKPDSMDADNYYRAILQNLFFATFNTPQDSGGSIARRWINAKTDEKGNGIGLSDDYNVATVYRYKDEFRNPDSFLAMMKKVPFLNCALFDCLDKVEDEEDGGRRLYFDGFSTKKARQAHVPNGLFFGNGDDGRLGIITLFSEYEFTIDENDADDADVSLDPELLGKVFENLLGAYNPETQETARKATGSFYTPREIVDYMVEESLKSYLRGRLEGRNGTKGTVLQTKLDDLFDKAKTAERAPTEFSRDEEKAILDALYSAKIIDPACGSGAFPMGVLHTMIRLMKRLDPDNTSIRGHLLERYKADKAANDPSETEEDRKDRLEELEKRLDEGRHYPDYERKLYLIENCIYGVDIQPIAAQISKLRFFISLLCDQFRTSYDLEKENYGLLSLPNLEAKFVCANTLIALPDTASEFDLTVGDVHKLREELVRNRHRIFGARSTKTKEKYKTRDKEIRRAIKSAVIKGLAKPDEKKIALWESQIEKARKLRKEVERPDWQEVEKPVQQDFFASTTVQPMMMKIDRNADRRDEIDREIRDCERAIEKERGKEAKANLSAAQDYANLVAGWDPFDQNASSPFFDPKWMFNIADGFDVVIGNPPYQQLQDNHGELADFYKPCGFETFERTGDIYCLFYEKGYGLLRNAGRLCFITSNKWMRAGYGEATRKFLAAKTEPELIIDFAGEKIFESATVDTNILLFAKGGRLSSAAERDAQAAREDTRPPILCHACVGNSECRKDLRGFVRRNVGLCEFPVEGSWVILSPIEQNIKRKMEAVGKPLKEWNVQINYGIKTGCNEAFIIDEAKRSEILANCRDNAERKRTEQIIRPVLRGRDTKRYKFDWAGLYLIATHNGYGRTPRIDIENYPAIKRHLDSYRAEISRRADKGDTPYNLRNCAYMAEFSVPKIVYREIGTAMDACMVPSGWFVNNKLFVVTGDNLSHIIGILNSRLFNHIIMGTTNLTSGKGVDWLQGIRIPLPDDKFPVSRLVDRILAAKKADPAADTSALEAEIDKLVYKLYGITDEKEIAVIEGRNVCDGKVAGNGGRGATTLPDGRGDSRGAGGHAGRVTLPKHRRNDDDEMLD